jgi:hypothetical protein
MAGINNLGFMNGLSNGLNGSAYRQAPASPLQQPGNVDILDGFQPSRDALEEGQTEHGDLVTQMALGQGLQGTAVQTVTPHGAVSKRTDGDWATMDKVNPSEKSFDRALGDYFASSQQGCIQDAATGTGDALAKGDNHAAINISSDQSKARMVDNLYGSMREAWAPGQHDSPEAIKQGQNLLHNYAKTYGLNENDLTHDTPNTGKARAALQNNLIAQANRGVASNQTGISNAEQSYAKNTHALADQKVSTVVAVGNEGQLESEMTADAGGRKPQGMGSDFYSNPYTNADTVNVGATGSTNDLNANSISNYSSPSPNVSLYANGNELKFIPSGSGKVRQTPEEGTSFAAPEVAADLANIHAQHQDFSNDQALQYLKQHKSHSMQTSQGPMPVLNTPTLAWGPPKGFVSLNLEQTSSNIAE